MNAFITFEGIDGSGKSSQVELLASFLHHQNIPFITTREPGGGNAVIRELLLERDLFNPHEQICLLFADRSLHWRQYIRPQQEAGNTIISDRYLDSSFAYQVGGQGVDRVFLENLEQALLPKEAIPDVTFLIDVAYSDVHDRLQQREKRNHLDRKDKDFYDRVRHEYQQRALQYPKRIVTIDGRLDKEGIFQRVRSELLKRNILNEHSRTR